MLQHRLKCLGLDPRNPSGPAVMPTAYKGRTHDRNRPDPSQLQKNPCKPGAVHTWIPACAGMTMVLAVSACTVGPDYERPAAPVPAAYKEASPTLVRWQVARPAVTKTAT